MRRDLQDGDTRETVSWMLEVVNMLINRAESRTSKLGEIYSAIAEKLNITKTQFEAAKTSYEAVGNYLREKLGDDETHQADVDVFPQGSMGLGTVVRPSDETEDFDVDLVCRLNDGVDYSEWFIKNSVGDALKDHEVYKKKILEKGEGKRCWTIDYDLYHMDVLPCVPISADTSDNSIRLTHKNPDESYIPKYSNPEDYRDWFLSNAKKLPGGLALACESREFGELVKLPVYTLKLPLQKAIQLLKRHRNLMFADAPNKDDAPISIIITTLVTMAYQGEQNVFTLIENALKVLPDLVKDDASGYCVKNPVIPEENFAEKWNTNPEKAAAFKEWCDRAFKDLVEKPKMLVLPELVKWLGKCLGEKPTAAVYEEMLESQRKLRESGRAVVTGCCDGLSVAATAIGTTATKVRPHTFYGR